jgi:two-component system osmolarity sensor histidine kinase EnvZ
MTRTVSRELVLILKEVDTARTPSIVDNRVAALATSLELELALTQDVAPSAYRRWYDFTGIVVIAEMIELVPEIEVVRLPDDVQVDVWVRTTKGLVHIRFDRSRVSATNPHQLLVNMLVFGGIMTIVAFIYLRNQLRPITRLAKAAEAFGRGRHEPYLPSGALEVRAAGSAFLDMRARIERQIEQRTMMLSGVSHDLRTPLTRLKLGLSLLDHEESEPLQRDVEDMQRLLDEFLSFARGASEGEAEEVDPVQLVNGVVDNCIRSGMQVTLGEVTGSGTVMLRRVAMQRALENLLNNAVRYGENARVAVRLTDKSLRIRVEDDGPGIPRDQREAAMKPFVRLDPSRNQDKGSGVGLGLAISADVARAHGGVLRLNESSDLGGLCADIVIAR